ncbi:unnamed protein product [Clavelina lepadiformis]|uniref:Metaxin glutathione S-transferase domain-containing protein n=1 Tax=Clavelina lepadiformis TaxID=159417 RepID=A0ABP0GD64_CLALP
MQPFYTGPHRVHGRFDTRFVIVMEDGSLKSVAKSRLKQYHKLTTGQGIGRHSEEEILKIAKLDLGGIADFLVEKEFFMGSQPSEVDAVIFGFVGLMIFTGSHSVSAKDVTENHSNLVERMKQMYWPDWDKLCIPEGTTSWDEMQQQCG